MSNLSLYCQLGKKKKIQSYLKRVEIHHGLLVVAVPRQLQLSALLLQRIAVVVKQRLLGLLLVRGLPVTPARYQRTNMSNPVTKS